jgi:hypothetical protein
MAPELVRLRELTAINGGPMRCHAAVLALLVLACGGTGPDDLDIDVQFTQIFVNPQPPSFLSEAGQLVIGGSIDLNEGCYDFAGSLGEVADTLVVRLRATREGSHCSVEPALFGYTLTITGLEPGDQPLHLVYDRVGPPSLVEVVFRGAVEIR